MEALKNSQDLLKENTDKIDDMTVGEWLQRLNLPELAPKFAALKVVSIQELKPFGDEKQHTDMGIEFKYAIHKNRFISMIEGKDKITKEDFNLITLNTGRQIIRKFV
jgi:hypothetical protein